MSLRKSTLRDSLIRERFQMSSGSLGEQILERAEEVGGEGSLGTRQGTRVASCRPGGGDSGSGWELLAPGDESLGSYDWVVVTSAPTPSGGGILRQVAEAAGSEALRSRVEEISTTLTSRAIYVATMAWEVEEGDTAPGGRLEALGRLYDITEIVGDEQVPPEQREERRPGGQRGPRPPAVNLREGPLATVVRTNSLFSGMYTTSCSRLGSS